MRIFKLNIRSTALAWRRLWRKLSEQPSIECKTWPKILLFIAFWHLLNCVSDIIVSIINLWSYIYQLYFTSELTRLEIEIECPTNWQGRWSWPVTKILSYHPPPPTLTLLHCFSASLHLPLSPPYSPLPTNRQDRGGGREIRLQSDQF